MRLLLGVVDRLQLVVVVPSLRFGITDVSLHLALEAILLQDSL